MPGSEVTQPNDHLNAIQATGPALLAGTEATRKAATYPIAIGPTSAAAWLATRYLPCAPVGLCATLMPNCSRISRSGISR